MKVPGRIMVSFVFLGAVPPVRADDMFMLVDVSFGDGSGCIRIF